MADGTKGEMQQALAALRAKEAAAQQEQTRIQAEFDKAKASRDALLTRYTDAYNRVSTAIAIVGQEVRSSGFEFVVDPAVTGDRAVSKGDGLLGSTTIMLRRANKVRGRLSVDMRADGSLTISSFNDIIPARNYSTVEELDSSEMQSMLQALVAYCANELARNG